MVFWSVRPSPSDKLSKPGEMIRNEPGERVATIAIGSCLIVDQFRKGLRFAVRGNQSGGMVRRERIE